MLVIEAAALLPLCWPEFVERDGGIFLARKLPSPLGISIHPDLTAAECACNHIHILDHFDHRASLDGSDADRGYWDAAHPDFLAACEIGGKMAAMWHAKLMHEWPAPQNLIQLV